MRRLQRTIGTMTLLLLGVGVVAAQAEPQFAGSWVLDRSQSQFPTHEGRDQGRRDEDRVRAELTSCDGAPALGRPVRVSTITRVFLSSGSGTSILRTSMAPLQETETESTTECVGRRHLLAGAVSLGALHLAPPLVRRAPAQARLSAYPFTLGVASGYPSPTGLVLCTRLPPSPLVPAGGMPPAGVCVA